MEKLINTLMRLARLRGCNPATPVLLTIQNDFVVCCSFTEPTFTEIPYNVLWISMLPTSPHYKKMLRRTHHTSDGIHRGSWIAVDDEASVYAVPQVYKFVVENPSDIGLDVSDLTVPHASTSVLGIVKLGAAGQAIVVGDNDSRLSDRRTPTDHDHPDYARRLIKIGNTAFAQVKGNLPAPNNVLMIVGQDSVNPSKFYADWQAVQESDVDWVSRKIERIEISVPSGNTFLPHEQATDLIGTVFYTDGTFVIEPHGVVWSISNNVWGITIDQHGVVTVPHLSADTSIVVTAQIVDPVFGATHTATKTLTCKYVAPAITLTSIAITGPSELLPKHSATYGITATYSDGTKTSVTGALVSNNAVIAMSGVVGTAGSPSADTTATITAAFGGLTATLDTLVHKLVPTAITISGATTLNEKASTTYTITTSYNDGTTNRQYTTFTSSNSSATLSGTTLTCATLTANASTTLTATRTLNGVTVNASAVVTLSNTGAEVSYIVVGGATSVNETQSTTYVGTVFYDDGTTRSVTTSEAAFTCTKGTIGATTGAFTAPSVSADTAATITLVATINGTQYTDTLDIVIKDVAATPVGATLSGPASANEATTSQYSVVVNMSDGTTATPDSVTWSTTLGTVSASGLVTWPKVMANTQATVTAVVTKSGQTYTKTATVTVSNLGNIVSVALIGSTSVNESASATYVLRATLEDGTTADYTPTLSLSSTTYASVSGNQLTAKALTADQTVVVTGTATAESKSWSANLTVTLKNLVPTLSSIAIVGASSINEGTTSAYTVTATYSDGTTATVTPKWTLTANGTGSTISGSTVTAGTVNADTTITLAASYLENGVTKTASKTITVTNVVVTAKPRYGVVNRVTSAAGFNSAFLASLTTVLAGVGADVFNIPANATTSDNGKWAYIALPAATHGYGYFREYIGVGSYGFAGSFDAAKDWVDGTMDYTGPATVTIGGTVWNIYRNDFPFEYMDYDIEVKYNSSDPMSGIA